MINPESLFVQAFNEMDLGIEAFMDVTSNRPVEFVTVERTGGPIDTFRDLPQLAVQVWAGSRWKASELALSVRDLFIMQVLRFHPQVARVTVGGLYNFPDPDSAQARYQITLSLVTKE